MEQTAKQGHRFRPGQSGNPHGRGSPAVRTRQQTAELIIEFRRIHGRDPGIAEVVILKNAAALAVRLERTLTADDIVRLSNSLARALRRLGLDPKPPDSPCAPYKTGAELVAEMRRDGRLK